MIISDPQDIAVNKFAVGDSVQLKRDRSFTLKVMCVYPPKLPDIKPSYGCLSVFSLADGYTPHHDFVGTLVVYKEYQLTREYKLAKVPSHYNATP